uniref:Uncharacterized protein n=1 Tax=Astyanax mexicanus TaxID=7994 RepID=A0A3B1KJW1_ASTMX
MASDLQLKRAPFPQEEEEEFQQILKQIGGKGNVYLVGDVNREDGECKCSLMKEFVADVLPVDDLHREINSNGGVKSDCCPGQDGQQRKPEVGASIRAKSDKGRAMRCALVIFIFRHSYVHEKANHVCVKEVLKDVKARTVGHGAWPGLLGLVHAHSESPETRESVELLEQMLRSVFRKHPHDSIWAGHFVPKALEGVQAIRRHVCKAVLSAQATGKVKGVGAGLILGGGHICQYEPNELISFLGGTNPPVSNIGWDMSHPSPPVPTPMGKVVH